MALRRGQRFGLAAAAMLAILFTPFPIRVTRPWKVQIVDRAEKPVPGCRVIESWMWSSMDSNLRTLEKKADAGGWVEFPDQTKWASLQQRVRGRIKALLTYHGGRYGPYLMIMAVQGGSGADGKPEVVSASWDEHARGVVEQNGVLTYRAQVLTSAEQVERERRTGR